MGQTLAENQNQTGGTSRAAALLQTAGLFLLLAIYAACLLALEGPRADREDVFFVDADCYSRMTRVLLLAEVEPWTTRDDGGGLILRRQSFENHPDGIQSHATFPLDGLILLGGRLLGGQREHFEEAGRWVSPVLGGLLLVGFWTWAVWRMRWGAAAWPGLLILAFSPILLHGFALGRPDHQSLTVLLCGLAILVEAAWRSLPHQGNHRSSDTVTGVVAGLLWGAALWVTWFEPLILWLASSVFWALLAWRKNKRGWWLGEVKTRGATLLVAAGVILLEGWPDSGLPAEYQETFWRWSRQIGELQGIPFWNGLPLWTGWLTLLVPFWLAWAGRKESSGTAWWLGFLLVLTVVLMGWHGRWGYFVALLAGLGVSAGFFLLPRNRVVRSLVWAGFLLGLWPFLGELDRLLFPPDARQQLFAVQMEERREARALAGWMREETTQGKQDGGLLAPWWITPSMVYWSGVPGVGGSSHQSLPGISHSARFWWSEEPEHWMQLLEERAVRWVLVAPPEDTLRMAGTLHPELTAADAEQTAGYRLWSAREIPELGDRLVLRQRGRFFRLWEVLDEKAFSGPAAPPPRPSANP
jgi:hypothetical protein